ncbi:MAG: hypothetical protein AAF657_37825, partial [Acidobacteriota bacterium]
MNEPLRQEEPNRDDEQKPHLVAVGEPEEVPDDAVPEDDTIIGIAFRRSLMVIGALALLGGGIYWLSQGSGAAAPEQIIEAAAPQAVEAVTEVPTIRFTDITAAAGIDFVHVNGGYGDKLLPETMGGGVAFFDFDEDGDEDLLFVNSSYWPHRQTA